MILKYLLKDGKGQKHSVTKSKHTMYKTHWANDHKNNNI